MSMKRTCAISSRKSDLVSADIRGLGAKNLRVLTGNQKIQSTFPNASVSTEGCGATSKSLRQGNHGVPVGGDGAGLVRLRARSYASRPAANSAAAIMKMANFRRLQDGSTASAGTLPVRFIPCGVASKAQEIYSARANPTARITKSTVTAEVRSSWPKSKSDTASTTSHAITAYAAATL